MIRILSLIVFLNVCCSHLFAQSLSYSCPFPAIIADTSLQTTHVSILNISNFGIQVHVKRDDSQKNPSHESYFCWGPACYPPFVNVSAMPDYIAPAGKDTSFGGYLNPLGNAGISKIRYTFYDASNTSDSLSILLTYDIRTNGVQENSSESKALSDPWPNPARSGSSIQYLLPDNGKAYTLTITEIQGKNIRTEMLKGKSGLIYIQTQSMQKGNYFISLQDRHKIISVKKLVIL